MRFLEAFCGLLLILGSACVQEVPFDNTGDAAGDNDVSVSPGCGADSACAADTPIPDGADDADFLASAECPVAVITVAEGAEVVAQTVLHLSSGSSTATDSEVAQWAWSVDQPEGSNSAFVSTANQSSVLFTPNVAGTYVFSLWVWDAAGEKSCVAGTFTVTVAAAEPPGPCVSNSGCAAPTPVCDVDSGLCVAASGECPVAVITVAEGDEVLPQTILQLSGASSFAPDGEVARWEWSVSQPLGSASTFFPSSQREQATFETNIVGVYVFTLSVWDELGKKSCVADTFAVSVLDDAPIRVELTWTTPGDLDESDTGPGKGSDLDLHFLMPQANGQYFDGAFDFWPGASQPPPWAGVGDDVPEFTRADEDGAGPENIVFEAPPDGTYRVGVHYREDSDFGVAYATLRVYIYGQLREQWSGIELVESELWDALEINWPSENVTRILDEGRPVILEDVDPNLGP